MEVRINDEGKRNARDIQPPSINPSAKRNFFSFFHKVFQTGISRSFRECAKIKLREAPTLP